MAEQKPKREPKSEGGNALMGRERQKDLLAIVCALASNPEVYANSQHIGLGETALVDVAEKILKEIEARK